MWGYPNCKGTGRSTLYYQDLINPKNIMKVTWVMSQNCQAQDWKRSVFIPIPKKGNAKEYSNYHTIAVISHASKIMLKILQARLQQYVNHELPDVQAGFRKARGTRDQMSTSVGSQKKQENSLKKQTNKTKKTIYFCFIDYTKAFDCVDHNTLWKILKDMGIPDHLTCLLRNVYAGQEATVQNWTQNHRLISNQERVMSRLYTVTLLI